MAEEQWSEHWNPGNLMYRITSLVGAAKRARPTLDRMGVFVPDSTVWRDFESPEKFCNFMEINGIKWAMGYAPGEKTLPYGPPPADFDRPGYWVWGKK